MSPRDAGAPGQWMGIPPHGDAEWSLQFDMRERGRRLRELAKATEGRVLTEVEPGVWRYEPIARGAA